jgi:hypothetical protein
MRHAGKFYWRWIAATVSQPLGAAGAVYTVADLLAQTLPLGWRDLESLIKTTGARVGWWAAICALVVSALRAPYIMHEELRSRLARLEDAKPRFKVRRAAVEGRAIHRGNPEHIQAIGRPMVPFVTFVNEPESIIDGAVASSVTAEVQYLTPEGAELGSLEGFWPISNPARGGPTPNGDIASADFAIGQMRNLTLGMKWDHTPGWTAITNGGVMAFHWGSPPEFQIAEPVTHVRVRLRGLLVDQLFWFEVRNEPPQPLTVAEIAAPEYADAG